MAISVNWITGEITVPRADNPIIQASPEIRSFDTVQFFNDLKDLEASADGIPWPDTQTHNSEVTISGIIYAASLEIIAPYFVTFEDGQYTVRLDGTNNNIVDVATANQVRLILGNSAGLSRVQEINDIWVDHSLDTNNPKTITEITEGSSYDEDAGQIQKEVRKVGALTTVTRQ